MKSLIIYDTQGKIYYQAIGSVLEPSGIPFLWVELSDGQYVSGVDVSKTPNEAIIKDINSFDFDHATLEESQIYQIDLSNNLLEEYLKGHPFLYTDGMYYTATKEKQNLLSARFMSYQLELQMGIAEPELTWNSTGELCVPWTYENLAKLALAIKSYVLPLVKKQQEYEKLIRQCTTAKEVSQVIITYDADM